MHIDEKLQYGFPENEVGSKAVWNFSKNSAILVQTGFPKYAR